MSLKTENWKTFYLKDLYTIKMGNKFDKNKMTDEEPQVNFVSRVSYNNGVDGKVDFVENVIPYRAGLLTVALGGSYLGSCFVQEEPFYTGQNVAVMEAKAKEMTHSINLFISSLVRYESKIKYYAFGRELNTHINRDFNIKLPILYKEDETPFIDETHKYSEEGYVPDWNYIENYMMSLHYKSLTTKNKANQNAKLDIQNWKDFKISRTRQQAGLFEIENCKCGNAGNLEDGTDINYIGAKKTDNGVMRSVSLEPELVTKGHGIIFICDGEGSCGYTNYIESDFIGSTTISIGYDDALTKSNALFLVTVLDLDKYKYSHGRKYRVHIDEIIVKLPILHNEDGTPFTDETHKYSEEGFVPDWKFMENYIKSLPYGDKLEDVV
ncbi:MAG: restriction endonuclease subunit S [Spirochaetaceae bacterium]|nr:restriction endonuclease subunit S [Spirochaetaceae bacterium]